MIAAGCLLLTAAACSDGDDHSRSSDATATVPSTPPATPEQRAAVEDAAAKYQADLIQLQETGRTALAPGGDVASFYAQFGATTRAAVERYTALDVPAGRASVHQRVLDLLEEQAGVLDEIAAGASAGESDSLGPQLDRLTELLGDVATANAELLRQVGITSPPGDDT